MSADDVLTKILTRMNSYHAPEPQLQPKRAAAAPQPSEAKAKKRKKEEDDVVVVIDPAATARAIQDDDELDKACEALVNATSEKKEKEKKEKKKKENPPEPPRVEKTTVEQIGEYSLIETDEQAAEAMRYIQAFKVIGVDCEGVGLGRNGRLCLVQVSTPNRLAFVFDVTDPARMSAVLGPRTPLRAVLEGPETLKVFHDCRSDSDALGHLAGVTLRNVFDTQVAHAVLARQTVRGGTVPIPIGFGAIVRRYLRGFKVEEAKEAMHQKMNADRELWTKRPLPEDALAYAATDALLLLPLHTVLDASMSSHEKKMTAKYSEVFTRQVRESPDGARASGGEEKDIPLYGIREWDIEVELFVESLKKRGGWRTKKSSPAPEAPPAPTAPSATSTVCGK